jgi:hypothetical protein
MQQLWAKILAGEANNAGSFSRRTVIMLSSMDLRECSIFEMLCNYTVKFCDDQLLIFNYGDSIYNNNGIDFITLANMDSIGLITRGDFGNFQLKNIQQENFSIEYHDRRLKLQLPAGTKTFDLGRVMFTINGRELSRICSKKPIDGFFDYIVKALKAYKPVELC